MRGKFIVFEGIDGCGKSTQAELLVKRLNEMGYPSILTRECTDGHIGKLLREEYLSGKRGADESVINVLMAADRLEHVHEIKAHLDNGINVICDRYVLSGLAYDNYKAITEKNFRYTLMMNRKALDICVPDITFYLDIPVDKSLKRIDIRSTGEKDVYEDEEKLKAIKTAYTESFKFMEELSYYNMNIVTINADDYVDNINNHIMDYAVNYINNHGVITSKIN